MRRVRGLAGSGVVVLAAWAAACASSATAVRPPDLEGEWEWVRAFGGIAGTERTPESEGHTLELRFLAGERVELYRDGELEHRTTYEIEGGAGPRGEDVIVYEEPLFGFPKQTVLLEDEDTLVLVDFCCDGFEWEFVRE